MGHTECLNNLQPLDDAKLFLAGCGLQLTTELLGKLLQIQLRQQLFNSLRAHAGPEVILILFAHVAVLFFAEDLVLGQGAVTGIDDDIRGKIQDFLQDSGANVQQQAHPRGDPLEIPDVGRRRGQLDVAHTLAANLGLGDLYAAAVTDLTLVADLFILTAVALPVLGRAKNLFAEQALTLGLQGTVIDGFRFFDFAKRPFADLFR